MNDNNLPNPDDSYSVHISPRPQEPKKDLLSIALIILFAVPTGIIVLLAMGYFFLSFMGAIIGTILGFVGIVAMILGADPKVVFSINDTIGIWALGISVLIAIIFGVRQMISR